MSPKSQNLTTPPSPCYHMRGQSVRKCALTPNNVEYKPEHDPRFGCGVWVCVELCVRARSLCTEAGWGGWTWSAEFWSILIILRKFVIHSKEITGHSHLKTNYRLPEGCLKVACKWYHWYVCDFDVILHHLVSIMSPKSSKNYILVNDLDLSHWMWYPNFNTCMSCFS